MFLEEYREVDAGKTTFAMGLVSRLDALGVKPRAGNDYWYDHDLVPSGWVTAGSG